MYNAYADTLEALKRSHETYVGRHLARTRCKMPRKLRGVGPASLHVRLRQCRERPTLAEGGALALPGGKLRAGRHAEAVLAYWDILHSADAVMENMGVMKDNSTPDDAVLHLHKLLVVDHFGVLAAAQQRLRDAVTRLMASLV